MAPSPQLPHIGRHERLWPRREIGYVGPTHLTVGTSMQDSEQRPIDLAGLDPLEAARILAPGIRERAEHIERERRIPDELATSLAEAGLFGLCVPRTLGGREADVATLVQTIETIAQL